MSTHSRSNKLFNILSLFVSLTILISPLPQAALAATSISIPASGLEQQAVPDDEDLIIQKHPLTGMIRFLGASRAMPVENRTKSPGMLSKAFSFEDTARQFMHDHGAAFGIHQPVDELILKKAWQSQSGQYFIRFQQQYQGIPVLAGEMNIQMDAAGNIISVNGEVLPEIDINPIPAISAKQAVSTAQVYVSSEAGIPVEELMSSEASLWIYSPILMKSMPGEAQLIWSVDVSDRSQEFLFKTLFVNAHNGDVKAAIDQRRKAFAFEVWDAGDTSSPLCSTNPTECGSVDSDERKAAVYTKDVYDFFMNYHGQDSIDNDGMPLVSVVRYGTGTTFWTGDRAIFAQGWSQADDIVAHEFVHGFTEYTSGLFNWYQSGAISESLSDLWAEIIDQQNGKGNDNSAVKWLIGEDLPAHLRNDNPALRNMKNPPQYNQPDKITSALYYTGVNDNGGVHTNSGVNNKAATLMIEGGTFNSHTVTGIGAAKVIAIYYETQANYLLSGSDYLDLHDAVYQACRGLEGTKPYQAASIITASDCRQVRNATLAVEMDKQPVPDYNPKAPLLDPGKFVMTHYREDWEQGSGNWVINGAGWEYDGSVYKPHLGRNAYSGLHAFYAHDTYANANSYLTMGTGIVIPPAAYMVFYHHYDLEYQKDGGVVEYSSDGGATWIDAGVLIDEKKLIDYNSYDSSIASAGSVLDGRQVFTGRSNGYISTRLNLTSLAAKTVKFRWQFASDGSGHQLGWWLDDIWIYTERPQIFADVPNPPWREFAETLYLNSVTGGCSTSPLMYCPDSFVNRAQMAVFLLRSKYGKDYYPPPAKHIFSDVTPNSFFEPWIEQLAAEGITAGCGGDKFCPNDSVTRAQMAIFLLRTRYGKEYTPPPFTGIFGDVSSSFFAPFIEQLYRDGVTGGCSVTPLLYCPNGKVTRGQMAIFLSRMFNLQYPQ
jgi:bacillolysin